MRKRVIASVLAVVLVFALMYAIVYLRPPSGEVYSTFTSPDSRFKVVVYKSEQASKQMVMPGGSGDAPGTVFLVEAATGRILKRKAVEMVQIIDRIEWSSTNVNIKLFTEWKLP